MTRLRARLPHLFSLWAGTAVAQALMYYFFLSRPYFRAFFAPFAAAVLVIAVFATAQMVRPRRDGDRRAHERRVARRR
jgi:CBS-domain-containing membrane protein